MGFRKKFFITKEAAEQELERKRKNAIRRIEKRGDKVLGDSSKVYQEDGVWYTWLEIYTEQMIEDLKNLKGVDEIQKEEHRLISEIQASIDKKILFTAINLKR